MSNDIIKTYDSETTRVIVKHLWPTMLFLVIMDLIILFGSYWWTHSPYDRVSSTIAMWVWFLSSIAIAAFGVRAFILDAGIKFTKSQSNEEVA